MLLKFCLAGGNWLVRSLADSFNVFYLILLLITFVLESNLSVTQEGVGVRGAWGEGGFLKMG